MSSSATDSSGNTSGLRRILKAILPASVYGLILLISFTFLAQLFAQVGSTSVFSNSSFMSSLGFFVGFVGKLGTEVEQGILSLG